MNQLTSLATVPGSVRSESTGFSRDLDVACAAVDAQRVSTLRERLQALDSLARRLSAEAEYLVQLLAVETGVSRAHARREVDQCLRACDFYARNGPAWLRGPARPRGQWRSPSVSTYPHSLGVLVAVTPERSPLWQVVRLALPALIAADAVVLTHAARAPASLTRIAALTLEAGFPAGTVQLTLAGGRPVDELIGDERVAAVAYLRDRDTAMSAYRPVDTAVISPEQDLQAAAEAGAMAMARGRSPAAFSPRRFVVHAEVFGEFSQQLVEAVGALIVGADDEPAAEVGPLVDARSLATLTAAVAQAVAQGARVLCTGMTPRAPGRFYPPTVLTDVASNGLLYRAQPEGPVAVLCCAADLDEALDLAQGTADRLGATLWRVSGLRGHSGAEPAARRAIVEPALSIRSAAPDRGGPDSGTWTVYPAHG